MKSILPVCEPIAPVQPAARSMVNHFALIPDGNRRWAKEKKLPDGEGHRRAFLEKAPELLSHIWNKGVHTATLWMFSHDNWKRSENEVKLLMLLYHDFLEIMMNMAGQMNISLVHMGRKDRLPVSLCKKITEVEIRTEGYSSHTLLFGIDYSGHDELLRAINQLLSEENVSMPLTPDKLAKLLDTSKTIYPYPDIVMRSSGEKRTSGFMPWQCAYSEYFFSPKNFPDLCTDDIDDVLKAYQLRDRRYGG